MTYVHFDRAAVAEALRQSFDASLELALRDAKNADQRTYLLAQHQFRDVIAGAFALFIDMRNAGRDGNFIGSVLGAAFGTLAANVIRHSEDPKACLHAFRSVSTAAFEQGLLGGRADFSSAGPTVVYGQTGGRA